MDDVLTNPPPSVHSTRVRSNSVIPVCITDVSTQPTPALASPPPTHSPAPTPSNPPTDTSPLHRVALAASWLKFRLCVLRTHGRLLLFRDGDSNSVDTSKYQR
jgi:hypothetical protein